MSYFLAGMTIQYRIKPNLEWITIDISNIFLKAEITPNPFIDISGVKSGTIIEVRVRLKNEIGFGKYGAISEIAVK